MIVTVRQDGDGKGRAGDQHRQEGRKKHRRQKIQQLAVAGEGREDEYVCCWSDQGRHRREEEGDPHATSMEAGGKKDEGGASIATKKGQRRQRGQGASKKSAGKGSFEYVKKKKNGNKCNCGTLKS